MKERPAKCVSSKRASNSRGLRVYLGNYAWTSGRKEKTTVYLLDSVRLRAVSLLLNNSRGRTQRITQRTCKRWVVRVRAWYVKPRPASRAGDSLCVSHTHYLCILIGSLDCLYPLWLATLVLVLRHILKTALYFNAGSELIISNWPEWTLDNLLCLALWLDE